MNWEYELSYPTRRGFTRVGVTMPITGAVLTHYDPGTLGESFRRADPFHFPAHPYYWEDGTGVFLTSAEQYAIRKNAPSS